MVGVGSPVDHGKGSSGEPGQPATQVALAQGTPRRASHLGGGTSQGQITPSIQTHTPSTHLWQSNGAEPSVPPPLSGSESRGFRGLLCCRAPPPRSRPPAPPWCPRNSGPRTRRCQHLPALRRRSGEGEESKQHPQPDSHSKGGIKVSFRMSGVAVGCRFSLFEHGIRTSSGCSLEGSQPKKRELARTGELTAAAPALHSFSFLPSKLL